MKKLLTIVFMVVVSASAIWAWDYDKAVAKYLKKNQEISAETKQALDTKTLVKGMDIEAAKIVGKLLSRHRHIVGWAYADTCKVENISTEEGSKTVVSIRDVDVSQPTTYVKNSSGKTVAKTTSNKMDVSVRDFVVMEFVEGKLVSWKVTQSK